jgi:hypothetical protein
MGFALKQSNAQPVFSRSFCRLKAGSPAADNDDIVVVHILS